MFAGIVEESAQVAGIETREGYARLSIASSLDHAATNIGDSIAIEGVCLTVVKKAANVLDFELAAETLRRSTLGDLKEGDRVNLERSLEIGSRLHGHFVFGHVDGVSLLLERKPDGECERYLWSIPQGLGAYLAPKGSVSLAGVSLTVGEVQKDSFAVYIIPHTAAVTTLAARKVGMRANFEVDMLARYVHAALGGKNMEGGASSFAKATSDKPAPPRPAEDV